MIKDFIVIGRRNYVNKFVLIFWGQPVPILGILGIIGREVVLMISRITETNFGIIWLLRITKMYFVLQALVSSYCWLLTCLFSFYLFSNMITLGHDIELINTFLFAAVPLHLSSSHSWSFLFTPLAVPPWRFSHPRQPPGLILLHRRHRSLTQFSCGSLAWCRQIFKTAWSVGGAYLIFMDGSLCVIYTTLFTVSMSVGCDSVVELGALPRWRKLLRLARIVP